MTAWSDVQQDWALNTEADEITGILLWDLTAAFETMDPEILCEKLMIYGFHHKSMFPFIISKVVQLKITDEINCILLYYILFYLFLAEALLSD